jgi:hypothetical protein
MLARLFRVPARDVGRARRGLWGAGRLHPLAVRRRSTYKVSARTPIPDRTERRGDRAFPSEKGAGSVQAHVTDEPTKLGNARAPRCDGRAGIGVLDAFGQRLGRACLAAELWGRWRAHVGGRGGHSPRLWGPWHAAVGHQRPDRAAGRPRLPLAADRHDLGSQAGAQVGGGADLSRLDERLDVGHRGGPGFSSPIPSPHAGEAAKAEVQARVPGVVGAPAVPVLPARVAVGGGVEGDLVSGRRGEGIVRGEGSL